VDPLCVIALDHCATDPRSVSPSRPLDFVARTHVIVNQLFGCQRLASGDAEDRLQLPSSIEDIYLHSAKGTSGSG